MKRVKNILFYLAVSLLMPSCIFESVPECPAKEEYLIGGWVLTAFEINNVPQSGDVSQFRLVLFESGTFTRKSLDGYSDSGTWLLTNNEQVVELTPDGAPSEDYIIDALSLRKLVLFVDRDNTKVGPDNLKLFLNRFN
jgi:hypothetical protein